MSFQSQLNAERFTLDLKSKQLSMSVSRDKIDYRALGLIEVESVVIDDLRTKNEVVGGTLQGYQFTMTVVVPTQSVFIENTYVADREELSRGRWFVSLSELETRRTRTTPVAVALDCVEQNFEGTRITFTIQTEDLEWLKHASPTAPQVVSPILITSSSLPVPLAESNNDTNLQFQLTNPLLSTSVENLVVYDLLLYSNPSRTTLVWSELNLTKAQVIDAPFTSSTISSALQRGIIYYGVARCKLASQSADTLFRLVVKFEEPQFIAPTPANNAIIDYTNVIVDFRVERGSANALASVADFEFKRVSLATTTTNTSNYSVAGEAQTSITLSALAQEDVYEVRARSRSASALSDWTPTRTFTARVFRALPIIANFQPNRTKIASGDLTALPFQQVVLTVTIIAKDVFAGNLRVQLLDVTSSPTLLQEEVWSTPAFDDVRTFVFTDNPAMTKSYRVDVLNVNNQVVSSTTITITEVQLLTADLYVHFTPREGLFNDTSATTVANTGDKVARWNPRVSNLTGYHLLNDDIPTQPFKRVNAGGMPFVEFTTPLSHLIQPISQQALPSETPFTCYVLALVSSTPVGASILNLKNNALLSNTYLGLRHDEIWIRYIDVSNNSVSDALSNGGAFYLPIVFVFSFKRVGNTALLAQADAASPPMFTTLKLFTI